MNELLACIALPLLVAALLVCSVAFFIVWLLKDENRRR
jgi:uncharacterized membrane protein YqjE